MIERWLMEVRDHPKRPPAMQRHVLTMLALRMDWTTGSGFVSTFQLMADADASKITVWRATKWARDNDLLVQTRRGHRLGNGQVVASEWQLSQGFTGETLTQPQGFNGDISTFHPATTINSPLHQESYKDRSPSASQGQGQTRCAVNSHKPRVTDAPDLDGPQAQQIRDQVPHGAQPYRSVSDDDDNPDSPWATISIGYRYDDTSGTIGLAPTGTEG